MDFCPIKKNIVFWHRTKTSKKADTIDPCSPHVRKRFEKIKLLASLFVSIFQHFPEWLKVMQSMPASHFQWLYTIKNLLFRSKFQ
jgi:hypothetical protein